MKKLLIAVIFSTLAFGQAYHMQSVLGVEEGVRVADFEKGMTHHNKAHTGLGAVNTFSIVNGPNAGKYVRVAAAQWPTPLDMVDSVYDAMSNHDPVPYDKWNDSMIEQIGGMEFWTIRPDLSRNMPTVDGANVNNQGPPNFITVYYYGVQQGGTANTEYVFSKFRDTLSKLSEMRFQDFGIPFRSPRLPPGGKIWAPGGLVGENLAPRRSGELDRASGRPRGRPRGASCKFPRGKKWIWPES